MANEFPGGSASAARFRAGIRTAMTMGLDPDEGERVTFLFAPQLVYMADSEEAPTDEAEVPFDPDVTVQETTPTPVQVACAVEYFDSQSQPINGFGNVVPSRIVVTVLDEEYQEVKDAIAVVIQGDRYNYVKTQPPLGLFSVGLYQLHYQVVNET